ncbi:MAG: hypothetical protein AB7O47_02085 [Flavobacteriales bacterium]
MNQSGKNNKEGQITYQFYESIFSVNEQHWNKINNNLYLSINYLKALETALKFQLKFQYILFYKNNDPVAIASVQLVKFIDKGSKYQEQICILTNHIKNKLIQSLEVGLMVCGNVFCCGENGFIYSNELTDEEAYLSLNSALKELRKQEESTWKSSVILLKEFWPDNFKRSDQLKKDDFRDFMIDVNMILQIHPSWKNLDDYLMSMTAKFRTKAKSVEKKSAKLVRKELNVEEILLHQARIEELYHFVVDKSEYSIGELNGQAFVNFKQLLNEQFILTGYFLDEQLIGFSSAFWFNNILDANYVGIDYDYNIDYSLYQRMLYDLVEVAVNKNVTELRFGRTAEEVKSCLGAVPTDMKLYVKHKNSVKNKLLKPIVKTISPSDFELRNPFKANFAF